MAGFKDGLNKAKSMLQGLGGKALDGAMDLYVKARPGVERTLEKASDGAKELIDRAKPGVQEAMGKVAEGTRELYEKAAPAIAEGAGKAVEGAKSFTQKLTSGMGRQGGDVSADATPSKTPAEPTEPAEPVTPPSLQQEAEARMEQVRGSATGTNSIHDYIQRKYGQAAGSQSDAEPAPQPETAPTDAATAALEEAARAAREAAEAAHQAAFHMRDSLGADVQQMAERVQALYHEVAGQDAPEPEAPFFTLDGGAAPEEAPMDGAAQEADAEEPPAEDAAEVSFDGIFTMEDDADADEPVDLTPPADPNEIYWDEPRLPEE